MTAVKVIGIFDSMDEAQRARERLVAEGVPAGGIRVGPDAAGDGSAASTSASTSEEEGGFFAWLRSLFTDDEDDRRYADATSEAVRRGSCVVAVEAANEAQAEQAERVMQSHGAVDVEQRAERWRAEGWSGYDETAPRLAGDELERERQRNAERVPIVREELRVGKREVVRGGVRVVTRIVDRPVEEQVTLREEHARVERRAVDRPPTEQELRGLKEGTIEVTERAEEPVIGKTTRVVEEIEVGKEAGTRTETVRDTVRETKVEVQQMTAETPGGGVRQPGAAAGRPDPGAPAKPKQRR